MSCFSSSRRCGAQWAVSARNPPTTHAPHTRLLARLHPALSRLLHQLVLRHLRAGQPGATRHACGSGACLAPLLLALVEAREEVPAAAQAAFSPARRAHAAPRRAPARFLVEHSLAVLVAPRALGDVPRGSLRLRKERAAVSTQHAARRAQAARTRSSAGRASMAAGGSHTGATSTRRRCDWAVQHVHAVQPALGSVVASEAVPFFLAPRHSRHPS